MGFLSPALLLFAVPAFYALWRTRSRRTLVNVVRSAAVLALVLAAPPSELASLVRSVVKNGFVVTTVVDPDPAPEVSLSPSLLPSGSSPPHPPSTKSAAVTQHSTARLTTWSR